MKLPISAHIEFSSIPTMTRCRSEKTAETDIKVEAAIKGLANGSYKTPYATATALRLSRATLSCWLAEENSRAEGKENQQNLTHKEEKALAHWLSQLTATGHSARYPFICEIAEEIRKQCHSSSTTISYPVQGDSWVSQFLNCQLTFHTTIFHLIESARI